MNKTGYIALAVLVLALIAFAWKLSSLTSKVETQNGNLRSTIAAAQDSMMLLRRQVDSLKQQVPGLGEYMSGVQLHISKLWFAAQALNWDLASYELNELGEAIEGAEALRATRDSVNITAVLQSLHDTQLDLLTRSVRSRHRQAFLDAYSQTIATCNGCHRAAGYGFIHIITPTAPPVTNQRWVPGTP